MADGAGSGAGAITVVTELERKLEASTDFELPDLGDLEPVARVSAPREHLLEATYLDSEDLRLASRRLTLRRRTGGDDAGWHLKRPARGTRGARDELRMPLGSSPDVPRELRAQVEVHLRGRELVEVVRLTTRRTVTTLLDAAGGVLVEIAQDRVEAVRPGAQGHEPVSTSWEELEVELVGGEPELLDAVTARLLAAGAAPSASASKLARALGPRLPATSGADGNAPARAGRNRTVGPVPGAGESAGQVVLVHLTEHVERLVRNDPLVRADEHDAVHQMRVAARRLRSALATYRPLFDRSLTDPVRDELRWLGAVLGEARDVEVARAHVLAAVAAEPADLVVGPVEQRITRTMGERYQSAHDRALAEMDGQRYFALLDSLDRLLADPPLAPVAQEPAEEVLPALVARTYRRVRRLVAAADEAGAAGEAGARDEALHEVRKAAKRARYAGESLVPRFGADAVRFAEAFEGVQEVLGEFQDSLVIREELQGLAAQAAAEGDSAFTFGRLHALEQARAARTEEAFERAWTAASRKRLRRWLR